MDIKNLKDSDMKHRSYYNVSKKKVSLFDNSWEDIKLPDPPANDSPETYEELKLIEKLIKTKTENKNKEIKEQDGYWPRLNELIYNSLNVDDETLKKLTDQGQHFWPAIWEKSLKYSHPRQLVAQHTLADMLYSVP